MQPKKKSTMIVPGWYFTTSRQGDPSKKKTSPVFDVWGKEKRVSKHRLKTPPKHLKHREERWGNQPRKKKDQALAVEALSPSRHEKGGGGCAHAKPPCKAATIHLQGEERVPNAIPTPRNLFLAGYFFFPGHQSTTFHDSFPKSRNRASNRNKNNLSMWITSLPLPFHSFLDGDFSSMVRPTS